MTTEEKEAHLKSYLMNLLDNKFLYRELEEEAIDRIRQSFGFKWYLFGKYCERFINYLKEGRLW